MKKYYNSNTHEYYTEGNSMTKRIDGGVFSGIPTVSQLTSWGYVEIDPLESYVQSSNDLKMARMSEILAELEATDYLTLKAFEGEDMSEHPGWKEQRAALREEYRRLEEQLNNLQP